MIRRHKDQEQKLSLRERFLYLSIISMMVLSWLGYYGTCQLEKQLSSLRLQLQTTQSQLAKTNEMKAIEVWGGSGATVNTEILSEYKAEYRAMLIFRLEVRSVDYLTDHEIVKSYLFDIDGTHRGVDVSLNDAFWSRLPSSTGYVHVYLAILPKSISSDRISCLADVETNQGHIIAHNASKSVLLLKKVKKGR